ncbi:ABC transporter ATP-binding protein [Nakamurella panacisegetis]|uniref:ABC transporter ATP-binding protein n=1 Tax=Nakamurella panacisegetis TaxID=1090615 RepID=UPI0038B2D41A
MTRPDRPGPDDAIVVDGLHRRFGDVTAVDGLSFRMATGSILSLLGPNGAGKTTTVEICEGFTRADAGQVRVLGLDPWRQSAALRPRIGVMLQAGGAHASARAGEMLDLVANCSANPLDPAALLDLLGLTPSARTPVRRLSGGQVQRLSLAMALVGRPELLFLDEPTAGLDPQARHLVWDLLRAARADGVSILLTTHLLDEAELLSDRIVIVDNGRCVAAGTPAELTGGGAQLRFTASPGLELDVLRSALPLGFTVAETAPGRYLLEGDIAPSTMATVTSFCARVGVMPSAMQVGSRSLDEVYLELTGKELRS